MMKCTYCGEEYPGEVTVCAVDGEPLVNTDPKLRAAAAAQSKPAISAPKSPFIRRKVPFYVGLFLIGFWYIWPNIDPVVGDRPIFQWFEARGLSYQTARTIDFFFYWALLLAGISCIIAAFRRREGVTKPDAQ